MESACRGRAGRKRTTGTSERSVAPLHADDKVSGPWPASLCEETTNFALLVVMAPDFWLKALKVEGPDADVYWRRNAASHSSTR